MDIKNSSIKSRLISKFSSLEKKLPLEKFIPSAFLIFLLCVIILIVMTFNNIIEYNKDLKLVQHTNEVLKRMENLYSQILEIPSQRRGYLNSGDKKYLNAFIFISQSLDSDFIKFQKLIYENPSQVKLVQSMDSLTRRIVQSLSSTIHIPMNDMTREYHTGITDTMQGNLDQIKIIKDQIVANETTLLEKRNIEVEASNSFVNLIIFATSIFSLLAIALSMYISNKLIKHKNSAEKLLTDSYEQLEDIVEEQTSQLKESNKILMLQYEVSKTISASKSREETMKAILEKICRGIDWEFGLFWTSDVIDNRLKLDAIWSVNERDENKFLMNHNEHFKIEKNQSLAGKVYYGGKSRWISDISAEKDFIRKENADKMGWKSALIIPVSNGKEVTAIIECFNKKSIPKNENMTEVLESAGRQIGVFIERINAEENLKKSYRQMEEKVKERTFELGETLNKLLKEIEEKEKFQNQIKLFAHAVKSIKECVYITDLDNKTLFVNKAFEMTYGFNENEILNKEIPILKNLSSNFSLKNEIMSMSRSSGWKGELYTQRKDGISFPAFLSTSLIKNEDGKLNAIIGICQDISDIKASEQIMNKRINLVNILNDVIKFTNKSFNLEQAIQYTIDKICMHINCDIGHCFLKKSDILQTANIWNNNISDKYLRFKKITDETVFSKGDGTPGKVSETGKAYWAKIKDILNDNNFKRAWITVEADLKTGIWIPILKNTENIGVIEFFKNEEEDIDKEVVECLINIGIELGSVAEKIEIIDRIKYSEKILNEAQHIAKLGSFEWEPLKNKINFSDEAKKIYEISQSNGELTSDKIIYQAADADKETVDKLTKKIFSEHIHPDTVVRITTSGGKLKYIKSVGKVFLNVNDEVEKVIGTVMDVTEIKLAEEKLKKTNEKLIETQKELIHNEKLAALGRFSSGIAHEIRNPLANISSLAQMVVNADVDEKNKKRLNYILKNSDIANQIIKNLLNFASPEDLILKNENLGMILNNVIEGAEARCSEKNIKIIKEISPEIPDFPIDRFKLESAFMNFISNSIDAMDSGGTIIIKASMMKTSNEITIDFIDDGTGIPQQNLDKILEPFFTTKHNGIGLGLGLAHQTIILHHGIFNIDSIEGKGTHIKLKLPITNFKNN